MPQIDFGLITDLLEPYNSWKLFPFPGKALPADKYKQQSIAAEIKSSTQRRATIEEEPQTSCQKTNTALCVFAEKGI
jgi:hypothetical protein